MRATEPSPALTISAAAAARKLGLGKAKTLALIHDGRLPAKQLDVSPANFAIMTDGGRRCPFRASYRVLRLRLRSWSATTVADFPASNVVCAGTGFTSASATILILSRVLARLA
jgi:hypothetical protein